MENNIQDTSNNIQYITNTNEDTSNNINSKSFILDPLSVIIKLAILGNKPIGTKIMIQNNIIYFQEPGMFQSLCRYVYNSNKTDIQYMYNPIEIACSKFLSKDYVSKKPRIKQLFTNALSGLKNLMETYKNTSIIVLCLNYYYAIIMNHMSGEPHENIFFQDNNSYLYTKNLINALNYQWTDDKIKVVLDIITFLNNNHMTNNVKSLENIMESNDKTSEYIILECSKK
jgi:hypothetical protein